MINNFRNFFKIEGLNPIILGLICGFYPFVFYVSNNFFKSNSLGHWVFFFAFFVGISILLFSLTFILIRLVKKIWVFRRHLLFIAIILITATLLSYASTLLIKKKILVVVFIVSAFLAYKFHENFKKLLYIIVLISVLPSLKILYKYYEVSKTINWLDQPDDIEEVLFVKKPNVYMIQPDGYTSRKQMKSSLYGHKTDLYDWLEQEEFTIYDDFKSNYPASLNSNSSMFAMRQHKFGSFIIPDLEMPYAREVISGNNPVVSIFKNNNYHTFFIAEDEYFQQNKCDQLYDYYNIDIDDVNYFSKGNGIVKDVFKDVKTALEVKIDKPKFFFIEKCLPHHVHFNAKNNRVETERKEYFKNMDEVDLWIKKTIALISKKDPHSIIIVLADHGGWVGIESYEEMFSTKNEELIKSIYSNLAAIKWNGYIENEFDKELKTNVNVFRVLFSVLSENKKYLDFLEKDSSYNLHLGSFLSRKKVVKVINNKGKVVYIKE